ncbi:MAG: hypothetical protein IPN71_14030 [Fibrobacteres bacterium]|nr:hypothetical protein [Fibrobacterota bacterium]
MILPSLLSLCAAATIDSNVVANPGFESDTLGWSSLWARSPDSAQAAMVQSGCHGGSKCREVRHLGSQDWTLFPSVRQPVGAGELWQWSAWAKVGLLQGDASISVVTRDSSGNVQAWSAFSVEVAGSDTLWQKVVARFVVPIGVATIQPRIVGNGVARVAFDDVDLRLVEPAVRIARLPVLANDSLRVSVDPLDLSIWMRDSLTGDTVRFGAVAGLRVDSVAWRGDTVGIRCRELSTDDTLVVSAWLRGGSLRISLQADSAHRMSSEFAFPGTPAVRSGQFMVSPRGTGIVWPVDAPTSPWSQTSSNFSHWQVSQAIAGATDGRTGFVVSLDQPWGWSQSAQRGNDGLLHPRTFIEPAKGVWARQRSLVVAPLRGGGFAEMARRHRQRQIELGRFRTWTEKAAVNPKIERLRGAVDFWVQGDWGRIRSSTFDTLRALGMERALVSLSGSDSVLFDSLDAKGWLTTVYENYADAYPNQVEPRDALYPDGIIRLADGSMMKGWLATNPDGSPSQAWEICSATHPKLARDALELERKKVRRNARFVDVELAIGLQECFSPHHPVDRGQDAAFRDAALAVVHDTFRLVTGSEQARDFAFSHVDWGEGPMSIASVDNAGYDWSTPEPPEPLMDSLSMDPAIRVPLLPLASHDGFAPTWYTGDGQSKVPQRWDDKDAWNALYATMPLIMPKGRRMWDSLRIRYLRSINLLSAIHSRMGFSKMTDFQILSSDRKVQRTRFETGWAVDANFDRVDRTEGSQSLPPKGFLATDGRERIGRIREDGRIVSLVRLSDRWFVDPDGGDIEIDGVSTSGPVLLRREGDSVLHVGMLGDQSEIVLNPASLPWPSVLTSARNDFDGSPVAMEMDSAGRIVLSRAKGGAFLRLAGCISALRVQMAPAGPRGRLFARGGRWVLQWNALAHAKIRWSHFDARGRTRDRWEGSVEPGSRQWPIPSGQGPGWVLVECDGRQETFTIPW